TCPNIAKSSRRYAMPCNKRWNVYVRWLAKRMQNLLTNAELRCHREAHRNRRNRLLTQRLQNNQGFTLPELLLSTFILGILAQLVAMNMLGHMPQRRLSGATRQMTWNLMRARMQAIKLRQNVQVAFVDAHTYTIWIDTNKNGVTDSGEAELKNLDNNYR